ncbi:MAG: ankyrin repeat domain-containing protein, partial [bacterium]
MKKKIILGTCLTLMLGLLIKTPLVFGDLNKQIDTFSTSLKTLKLKLVALATTINDVKNKLSKPTKSKEEIFEDLENFCKSGDFTSLKAYPLDLVTKNINLQKDLTNPPLLHTAILFGTPEERLNIVTFLIEHGAHINAVDALGKTPLHVACKKFGDNELTKKQNEEIIKFLIAKKADISIKDMTDKTPLDIAKKANNENYINLLIARALEIACDTGDRGILTDYIDAIAPEIINKKLDSSKNSYLHRAIANRAIAADIRLNVVKFLFEHGADVNAVNNGDNTPLHIACLEGGNEKIIKFLIKKNANLEAINIMEMAPLAYAAVSSHPEYTQVLTPAKENCPICSEDYGPNSFYKLTCCSQKICLRCFIK